MMNCTFFLDLKLIREHFGRDAQLLKCAEECSELAAATLRGNVTQMIEETADVLITSMNNREILGADAVDAEIRRKLARAKDRIIADMQKKSEDEWSAKVVVP